MEKHPLRQQRDATRCGSRAMCWMRWIIYKNTSIAALFKVGRSMSEQVCMESWPLCRSEGWKEPSRIEGQPGGEPAGEGVPHPHPVCVHRIQAVLPRRWRSDACLNCSFSSFRGRRGRGKPRRSGTVGPGFSHSRSFRGCWGCTPSNVLFAPESGVCCSQLARPICHHASLE